jgi:polyphosphate kinase
MRRRISLPVPDDAVLDRVEAAPRSLGMHAGRIDHELVRETWFDTAGDALRERRLTLRLRVGADGRQTLLLTRETGVSAEGIVEEEVVETPVAGAGLYATLGGTSELASAVREVADPASLRPRIALDIDREVRDLRPGVLGRPTLRATCDRIVAHAGGATKALFALELIELRAGGPSLEACVERARAEHGLTHDGMDMMERVRDSLGPAARASGVDTALEVRVVLVVQRGREVALVGTPRGLGLPSTRGSGEEIAREHLTDILGRSTADSDLELVGFVPPGRERAELEVWLYEWAPSEGAEPRGSKVALWMPLGELLERVGGPGLRGADLVEPLLVLVLSEIGRRLLREVKREWGPPRLVPAPARPPDVPPGKHPSDFLDPHLSILDFNQRVLELAEDESVPLLERLRFLGIFSSNLDELFTVRVGRLKTDERTGKGPGREWGGVTSDGGGASKRAMEAGGGAHDDTLAGEGLLDALAIRVRALVARQLRCLTEELLPALAAGGVRMRSWDGLDTDQQASLTAVFERDVLPALTPTTLSPSPGHPLPRLVSLGLSLMVVLQGEDGGGSQLAYVPLPGDMPRFVTVPGSPDVIPLEEVVKANVATLFPSTPLEEVHLFRVSRIGEIDLDEDASESLLAAMEDEVESRPFKPVIRLEVQRSMSREVRARLLRELHRERVGGESAWLERADVYEVDGPLDLSGFRELAELKLPSGDSGRFETFTPRRPLPQAGSIFDVLQEGDVLLHHPYDDFEDTVGRFLREAAEDPHVVSIKLTLYRTGRDSPVVAALLEALRRGKEVSVFLELKARFDEESNIAWTHRLAEAGGHVVYGVVGFKTHAKTALVVRREGGRLRRYTHVASGNYNAMTARLYTDLGLLSSDPDLGADLTDFFNVLTGSSGPPAESFRRLLVAPHTLADEMQRRIDREIEHARAGRPALIQAKLNGITDTKVVRALYRASEEGVRVDLVVRAICTLRAGLPDVSSRIRVVSILGRFLEHARIYYFHNAGADEYFTGSADWRTRNLRRRVEVVTPVDDATARSRLREILDAELSDPRAWVLRADGVWERRREPGPTAQTRFLSGTGGGPAEA